jgi:hypothetical protein
MARLPPSIFGTSALLLPAQAGSGSQHLSPVAPGPVECCGPEEVVSRSVSREKRFQLSIWVLQSYPFLPGLVEKQVADQLAVVFGPYLTEIDGWEGLYPSALETDAKLFSQLTVMCKREGRSVLPAVSIRNYYAVHSGRSEVHNREAAKCSASTKQRIFGHNLAEHHRLTPSYYYHHSLRRGP